MKHVVFVFILLLVASGLSALPLWETEDFIRQDAMRRYDPVWPQRIPDKGPEWQRWSYIREFFHTCEFIRSMQVSDSSSPDFGGMIEGENAMSVIETDNTQEAIWVWSRHRELTGDTTYNINIRRAWLYVMNNPAYNEEGVESDYYRVWNCGLAMFAEGKYRQVTGDSTYCGYADSCIAYMFTHPLPFTGVSGYYMRLHPKTTALAAGMLYQYGKENNLPECLDTALVYGERVIDWLEENPGVNLNDEIWAMSGGTCIWGICRSVFEDDSLYGREWLYTYLRFQKYLEALGQWNNSWNIWYANGYNTAGRMMNQYRYRLYHHSLTDSLLVQDTDNDGGVPPTKGDSHNGDHSWVSAYMVFMGFEGLMDSIRDFDAGIMRVISPTKRQVFLLGDTIDVKLLCANYGFRSLATVPVSISYPFLYDSSIALPTGAVDSVTFQTQWVPPDTGTYTFSAYTALVNEERVSNDTARAACKIPPSRIVTGVVKDRITSAPIYAELFFSVRGDSNSVFSASTTTDSTTGEYTVILFDSVFSIEVQPEIPYPVSFRDSAVVRPDTAIGFDFYIDPSALLVVNKDSNGNYSRYYSDNLDSLGVTFVLWEVLHQGLPPFGIMDQFGTRTIIWFSGDNATNTISPEEHDSLVAFLNEGGNLFFTGQNIAEEMGGSILFDSYIHADFASNTAANILFGIAGDTIGGGLNIYIVGGEANNQISQEIVAPIGGADSVFRYLGGGPGAVRYDGGTYKTVLFGFGFEALNSTGTFASRKEVLARVLNWFGIETGIGEEGPQLPVVKPTLSVYPNPFSSRVTIKLIGVSEYRCIGVPEIGIYDVTGRLAKRLSLEPSHSQLVTEVIWDGKDKFGKRIPAGVYYIKANIGGSKLTKKIVHIR
jgi:hypothetical protein